MNKTRRVAQVAEMFGINPGREAAHGPAWGELQLPQLTAGRLVFITGASGSGKSLLLRAMRRQWRGAWVDAGGIAMPERPVIDCLDGEIAVALRDLSRFGLSEAWSYVRSARQLSEGQQWRLRLAMAMRRAAAKGRPDRPAVLACDEFAATLDRVTAMVVAHTLRQTVDAGGGVAAVVVSSQDDLVAALSPDLIIRCDFGRTHVQCR